jgi:hypothetical protein
MDFDVEGAGKKIAIHAHNYYTVLFSALNYKPAADLQPCIDLEGMSAKVEYVESASTKTNGLIAVELRK